MNYPSIRIEGGILSPDILGRIEHADGQKPTHFELDSSAKVKDEILRVWADAQDYWRIFQRKLESLKADSPATTETRNLWIVPLLSLLGYQLEYQARATEVNGKNYPISHRITNRKQTALHIIGYREPSGLDRKPEKMLLRMSAHAMIQEYLNLSDQLYGIVTNGRVLRVLRDSSRLVKLSYLEFDLDRIFTDGLFADFAILFRLLHATRLPKNEESAASCWLERYHQKSIDEGTRIRDGLRDAVTEALEVLGTGFLAHPDNTMLRQQISSGELRPETYFSHLLRLIYRLLFLMVIEERGLVFPEDVPVKNVALYFQHYSVQRLRRLAVTRGLKLERYHDAWLSLLATFQLFENPTHAAKLGTTVLGGQLFNPQSLGPLAACRLSNAALFNGLDSLCNFNHPETKQRTPVNFGALATEEFGSIYESLLELHPVVEREPTPHFAFRQLAGNERKTTGSYYTPTSLVTCLLDSALDPVLENRIQNFESQGFKSVDEAVLALNVCDPACGSGHFLIAAAQRIARRLAILRAGDEEPSPELLRHTLRDVIGHCIHGVDVNPMSVELCKVALWLEAVEAGKPLNFLDHHIKCGNSLLGATPECIRNGIPDKAYEPITGDEKEAARWMRQLNKAAREGQSHLDFSKAMPWERLGNLPAAVAKLETLDDDTPEALASKEKLYREIVEGSGYESARLLHDTWCAAFVWPKQTKEYGSELTTEHLRKIERNPYSVAPGLNTKIHELATQYRFFHWHLEFPAVFGADGNDGFDIVLGNPPWGQIQFEPEEFFAVLSPNIAKTSNTDSRNKMIARLQVENPQLFSAYAAEIRQLQAYQLFVHASGRFPMTSYGRLNTAPLFCEVGREVTRSTGRVGLIVPTGIATDSFNQFFFNNVVNTNSLFSLFSFENEEFIFPAVHHATKFCLFTCGSAKGSSATTSEFVFFAREVEHLKDPERRFQLSPEDISLLNPNTQTCPIFRFNRDAELTKAFYRRVPVLIKEGPAQTNSWKITFQLMFMMNTDSHRFRTRAQLERDGWNLEGNVFKRAADDFLPLYEGKMIHHFDHRWGTYDGQTQAQANQGKLPELDAGMHADPHLLSVPHYWVSKADIEDRLAGVWRHNWLLGWRDITGAVVYRTVIASMLPRVAAANNLPLILSNNYAQSVAYLSANLNSFVLDYVARQKVGGSHINFYLIQQFPILVPGLYNEPCSWGNATQTLGDWLSPRVLELTYTAWDLGPFAQDCGWCGPPFRWDEERRFQLRCELDAAFFHLYLGSDEEWCRQPESLTRYFPTPRAAVAYIMDTFPIVKRKDEDQFISYRTKNTILAIYDALAES